MAVSIPHPRREWLFSLLVLCLLQAPLYEVTGQVKPSFKTQEDIKNADDGKRIYLKTNPLPILIGPIINTSEYRLGFELVGGHRFTYELYGSYLSKWIFLSTNLVDDTTRSIASQLQFPGFRAQGQIRYFAMKINDGETLSEYLEPFGLYIGLHASYAAAQLKLKNQNFPIQDWTNMTLTGRVGYQFLYEEAYGIDCFVGLGYKQNTAVLTDYRGRKSTIDIKDAVGPGLGNYITSPFKFSFGFNLAFGLL